MHKIYHNDDDNKDDNKTIDDLAKFHLKMIIYDLT